MTRRRHAAWTTAITTVAAVTLLLAAPAFAVATAPERIPAPPVAAQGSGPGAAPARTPGTAPLDPLFVLRQAMSGLEPVLRVVDPHGLGLRPSPVVGYSGAGAVSTAGPYPAFYDLRTLGKLTAVRDQGAFGTCWTFAALGSLESSSLPAETLDLSEDNLALTSGFNPGGATTAAQKYDVGGNADMAIAYLVRWGGPVLESDDAYGDATTPGGLSARRHVQNVDIWSGRTSATDNDRIKSALMTYGGVDVSMYWADASYNAATRAYYSTDTQHPNHDVVVVGWDDAFAADYFSPAAPGNGAFIVRNSWGAGFGASGYFYVSYYDARFGRQYTSGGVTYPNYAYTFEAAQPAGDYGALYQHDPLGATSTLGYGAGSPTWGANVFTASATSALNAVGFYANAPNTAYEIWVGSSLAGLTRLTLGTMPQMGYHTVPVPQGTTLTGGATFVVAVKLTTPGYAWPLAFEEPIPYYSSAATASAGQSYYSANGSNWTDLTTFAAGSNACIKAYASRVPISSSAYAFSGSATSGWKSTAQTVTITASGGDGTGRTIHYSQDGGTTWKTSTASSVDVLVSDEGAHDFRYYCSDSLATEPVRQAGYVNVDTVKPATSDDHLTVSLADPCMVTLSASDATSGVRTTEYKVDGAAAYTAGTSVVLHAGTHTVAYRSTDHAGNVEADRTFTLTVGSGAPVSQASYTGFAVDAVSGWHTAAQAVGVTAWTGAGAGLTIHTSTDGGATWSAAAGAAATILVDTQGSHEIAYYASDSEATEVTHRPGWVNVDSVAPVTSDDHPTAAVGPITVTLTPSDATSGMSGGLARTEYKVDDAPAYSSGTSVLLGEGVHTVAYRSTDKAGNTESPDRSFTVTVTGPPEPVSTCNYPFAADARGGWLNGPQQFTIAAAGGSGTGRAIHYTLDGGATWSTSTEPSVEVPVATEGAHHVQFYASDSLATEGLHDAGWVNVDTVRPWTTAARASVRRGARVTLRFRVNDGVPGSGRAKVRLQIRKRTRVVKTIVLGTRPANTSLRYRYTARLRRGTYSWRVLATDLAGNSVGRMRAARLVVR